MNTTLSHSALGSRPSGIKFSVWEGCYELQWSGIISRAAFAHPAKFARGLIERIYDHCLAVGYLRPGDLVGDPFGGIATGGITAAYRGLQWFGNELEPRFVALAQENIELHRARLVAMGKPIPVIGLGDSRKFHLKCGALAAGITSPPYADVAAGAGGLNTKPARRPGQQCGCRGASASQKANQRYGAAAGQISQLKGGELGGVVTSPPYAQSIERPSGIDQEKVKLPGGPNCQTHHAIYGKAEGQISALKSGQVDAAVTSPPFANSMVQSGDPNYAHKFRNGQESYGETAGQIGLLKSQSVNPKSEMAETYWMAMRAVYGSCLLAIKPGGVLVVVVKDYVAKKQRVRLCDDTCRLLEHVGFTIVERIQAMLVCRTVHGDLFNGEQVTKKERKSFFRRLAEKKGSPPIDFEEVIIARVPMDSELLKQGVHHE